MKWIITTNGLETETEGTTVEWITTTNGLETETRGTTTSVTETTVPPIQPAPDDASSSTEGSKTWIAGPVIGGVVFLLLLLGLVYYFRRRKRRGNKNGDKMEPMQFEKPQLHSECIPRTDFELEGPSILPAPTELPANQELHQELPGDSSFPNQGDSR